MGQIWGILLVVRIEDDVFVEGFRRNFDPTTVLHLQHLTACAHWSHVNGHDATASLSRETIDN